MEQQPRKVAALYARVSTLDQNCEVQLEDLRRYAGKRFASYSEYTDAGVSGTQRHRPQLDALMRDARRRLFDVVLVWKFDRFARSLKHLIESLDEFSALGIDFISLTEGIDTTTPAGQLLVSHCRCGCSVREGSDRGESSGWDGSCPGHGQTDRTPSRWGGCGGRLEVARGRSIPTGDCADARRSSVACAARPASASSQDCLIYGQDPSNRAFADPRRGR